MTGVVSAVFGAGAAPPAVLVGHSLGGAVAVHAAHAWRAGPLVGLIVVDVVEGSALEALSAMQTFLRGRPDRFQSVRHAIEWWSVAGEGHSGFRREAARGVSWGWHVVRYRKV